jgi:REP element-mobilizing transposase RayT
MHKLWHRRGYLPHFDGGAVTQAITFRLADSLPKEIYEALQTTVDGSSNRHRQLETIIDKGHGACLLKDPISANLVQDALRFFDGQRYRLIAWVIMPNHVHAMVEQMEGHRLGDIVRSWKRFTANQINKHQGTKGRIWAVDYFDRYVRDANHYENTIAYIENNPVKAGLVGRPENWAFSSYVVRFGR